jgi:hypothetical protein
MPTKRTPINRAQRRRVTPEAVEAFRAGDHTALGHALALKPWEASPLDVCDSHPPQSGTAWARSWPEVQRLRKELIQASK